jgi:hypothetical protein
MRVGNLSTERRLARTKKPSVRPNQTFLPETLHDDSAGRHTKLSG